MTTSTCNTEALGRPVAPRLTIIGGQNVGRGTDGIVCFGALRGGVGPCTRRKGLGGARLPGMFEYVFTDKTSVMVGIKPHRQESGKNN